MKRLVAYSNELFFHFRSFKDGQWYSFNDQHVSTVSIKYFVWANKIDSNLFWQCGHFGEMLNFHFVPIRYRHIEGYLSRQEAFRYLMLPCSSLEIWLWISLTSTDSNDIRRFQLKSTDFNEIHRFTADFMKLANMRFRPIIK